MKRRVLGLLLSSVMLGTCILGGCGNSASSTEGTAGTAENAETDSAAAEGEEAALEYYGNDISEAKELVVYVIGDEPVAADAVEEALNEKLQEKINTTIDISYIPMSDYTQKYSLLLASGENIDLIYTSTWAFYNEAATNGAFMEIKD